MASLFVWRGCGGWHRAGRGSVDSLHRPVASAFLLTGVVSVFHRPRNSSASDLRAASDPPPREQKPFRPDKISDRRSVNVVWPQRISFRSAGNVARYDRRAIPVRTTARGTTATANWIVIARSAASSFTRRPAHCAPHAFARPTS